LNALARPASPESTYAAWRLKFTRGERAAHNPGTEAFFSPTDKDDAMAYLICVVVSPAGAEGWRQDRPLSACCTSAEGRARRHGKDADTVRLPAAVPRPTRRPHRHREVPPSRMDAGAPVGGCSSSSPVRLPGTRSLLGREAVVEVRLGGNRTACVRRRRMDRHVSFVVFLDPSHSFGH
jgi:hypothetical protein